MTLLRDWPVGLAMVAATMALLVISLASNGARISAVDDASYEVAAIMQ